MKKLVVILSCVCLLLGMLAGCGEKKTEDTKPNASTPESNASAPETGEQKTDKTFKFTYIDPAAANSYWVDVASGITDAAKDLGIEMTMLGPDQVDQMKQIEDIEAAVIDKPDGLITMALNAAAFTSPVNYAVDNGVPVVLLDGDAPESKRSFYVGVDTYQQGVDVANEIFDRVGKDAKIGIVTAGLDIEIINARIDGLKSVCEDKGMEVVAIEDAQGDTILAGDKATAMLQTYPEINVMIAAGASDVPGVGLAIEELNLQDKVTSIAFNDDPQGLEYLKSGVYDFILCSLPYEEGYAAVQAMYYTLLGEIPEDGPDAVSLRSVIITAENADTYKNVTPPAFEDLLKAAK